jgi:hypothetical protein
MGEIEETSMVIHSVSNDWEEIIISLTPRKPRATVETKTHYIGVVYHGKKKLWRAFIGSKTIGWYDHPLLAAIDYDREARKKGKQTNF